MNEHSPYTRRELRCFTCPEGREQINGRYCTRLGCYVEHDAEARCGRDS